jgi:hypothetical protein
MNEKDDWISVDDALPEVPEGEYYSEMVLVTRAGIVSVGFLSLAGDWRGTLKGPYTHWMPIPPPPKEQP